MRAWGGKKGTHTHTSRAHRPHPKCFPKRAPPFRPSLVPPCLSHETIAGKSDGYGDREARDGHRRDSSRATGTSLHILCDILLPIVTKYLQPGHRNNGDLPTSLAHGTSLAEEEKEDIKLGRGVRPAAAVAFFPGGAVGTSSLYYSSG